MSENDDRPLRVQLTEARDRIRHELEILMSPSSIGGSANTASVVSALEAELTQIEDALAKQP
jgi:hypothetical protein